MCKAHYLFQLSEYLPTDVVSHIMNFKNIWTMAEYGRMEIKCLSKAFNFHSSILHHTGHFRHKHPVSLLCGKGNKHVREKFHHSPKYVKSQNEIIYTNNMNYVSMYVSRYLITSFKYLQECCTHGYLTELNKWVFNLR